MGDHIYIGGPRESDLLHPDSRRAADANKASALHHLTAGVLAEALIEAAALQGMTMAEINGVPVHQPETNSKLNDARREQ